MVTPEPASLRLAPKLRFAPGFWSIAIAAIIVALAVIMSIDWTGPSLGANAGITIGLAVAVGVLVLLVSAVLRIVRRS